MHGSGIEKGALPSGAVFERESAHVHAEQRAGRQGRRGRMQHARDARRGQRGAGDSPVAREGGKQRRQPLDPATGCECTRGARYLPRERPRAWRTGTGETRARAYQHRRVHKKIPGQQREQRRCEHIDAPRGPDRVGGDPGDERSERKRPADPGAPAKRTQQAHGAVLARAQTLGGKARPARNERGGARVFSLEPQRRLRRPGAIVFAPAAVRLRRRRRFIGAHQKRAAGIGFVHSVDV